MDRQTGLCDRRSEGYLVNEPVSVRNIISAELLMDSALLALSAGGEGSSMDCLQRVDGTKRARERQGSEC